ncbi:MAG: PIN domain nuclease [Thaumarchaeota archaeon]|nr:MAG: PIN domain nuclease [Nitrososphaerota archaeon]
MSRKFSLDTSVLIEYIVKSAPYRLKVIELLEKSATGEFELYLSPIILTEALYIASRVYEIAGEENPNESALNYVTWIKKRCNVIDIDDFISMRAGELKKALHIALPDCYVIATAEKVDAIPLFKKIEKEMKPVSEILKKLRVKFLDQI